MYTFDSRLTPITRGKIREESWGGLHYIRDLPCINVVNPAAYFLLSHCDGTRRIEDIEALMRAAFAATPEQIREDVQQYLLYAARHGYVEVPGVTRADFGAGVPETDREREAHMLDTVGVIGVRENALSAPIKVLIETTHNCNLRCVHCFADAACEIEAPRGYLPGELTAEQWCAVIDNLARAKVFDVFVSGGEALIRDDIFDILSHIQRSGFGFCLLSNMTLLDDAKAARLRDLGCYKVEGNMDGPDAASYDAFRGKAGAFDLTVRGIRACQEAGLPLRLNVTATKRNIHQLKDIARTVVDLGVKELCVVPLEPGGRAREDWDALALSMDDQVRLADYYREVSAWVASTFGDALCYIGPCDMLLAESDNKIVEMIDPNRILPLCGAGKFHCSIAPTGRVILCPTAGEAIPIEPGDALREDFRTIWRDAEVFRTLRNIDIPGCRSCEYQNCGGGCQVTSFLKYGEIGAYPDTECRKKFYNRLDEAQGPHALEV